MKIVFMGTPIFATAILEQLINDNYDVIGVVSQPDKKVGRKQIIQATPVKECALKHNIEVYQPISIKEGFDKIKEWNPDLIVTCAYGQMIPTSILDYPKYGSLNVHASLLPKLRGGAPIHKSIIYGEKETGVSIMRMVSKMDAGDYMLQNKVQIDIEDTTATLHDKLMECGALSIHQAIPLLTSGQAVFKKQDESKATFAYNITKEEEQIHPDNDVVSVYNHIRGLISWPIGYLFIKDKKIKLHEVRLGDQTTNHKVGSLFVLQKKLFLQCNNGTIQLLYVQLEGKQKCSALDFINGAGRNYID